MKRLLPGLCFVLSASLLGAAIAQSTPGFIHVDEIRPGMKGYGLSVFKGTAPERFDVEVIDVLHNFRPNQDMILIRTPHPLLNRARGVAGMSGSPIYLDGRLAGAYAYGWSFGSDPVVGVTPIASMLAELKRPVRLDMFPGAKPLPNGPRAESTKLPPSNERFAGLPPFHGQREVSAFSAIRALGKRRAAVQAPVGLHRATTPIMLGGLHDSVAHMLAKELEPLGFVATQSSVGGSSKGGPTRFEPGGAVAVELARGDISITGVGTVTYVGKGGRTLAFGHPMMEAGASGLPTATARVLHILVSESRSFKMAEAGQPLGTMVQDRQPAIVIDPNIEPARIPVRVKVNGVEGAPKTEWNVEVASHRVLTPSIVYGVIANAVKSTASDATDVIFRARSVLSTADVRTHGSRICQRVRKLPADLDRPGARSRVQPRGVSNLGCLGGIRGGRPRRGSDDLRQAAPGGSGRHHSRGQSPDSRGRCREDGARGDRRGQPGRNRAAATGVSRRSDRPGSAPLSRHLVGRGSSNALARPSFRGARRRLTARLSAELSSARQQHGR
ncbi:MAG: hypothetical protein JRI98_14775 [Deltaproteobacteria bacterium]|nr:hypothetical protein [Deltaproteobacteria bacterium]